ncbi:Aminoglycoside phosphotransferase domain-containing protein [Madurella fahalii]|uniref:Aminoglycoside phosphotransferase domain-containing protein n=1 Tax=Madurella fahalii TaxID=1157608 RepID=A0ABQ0GT33_9PEZI
MTPRWATCSVPRCKKPRDRKDGGCEKCSRNLCYKHASRSFHHCTPDEELDEPTWQAERAAALDRLRSEINLAAAAQYASELSDGRACSAEHTNMRGGLNYHVRIRFHDGATPWLLRIPQFRGLDRAPLSVIEQGLISEYATLKFLEGTAVPAPRAFGYGLLSDGTDQGIGAGFLLMEELPGKPWYNPGRTDDDNRDEKTKILSGVADIMAELARHPFPKAGSLYLEGSRLEVGPVPIDLFRALDPVGPFESAIEYYTAWAEGHLELIADRQVYLDYPVEAYLVYRFLKDNVGQLVQPRGRDRTEEQPREEFFLKHVDDRGDYLLVDDDHNITGVIDWQMARVVPKCEAFGPSLVTVNLASFYKGDVSPSEDDVYLRDALREKGHAELARWMDDENSKLRRFCYGLAFEIKWSDALPLANGILKVFGVKQEWEEWKEMALKEYSDDKRLQAVVKSCAPRRPHLPRRSKQAVRDSGKKKG